MIKYGNALCFDDILLVPQKSFIESRHSVNLSMIIGTGKRAVSLKFPVIAAPMDTVCDAAMCIAMSNVGGLGILHRYMPNDMQVTLAKSLANDGFNFGIAIASNNDFMHQAEKLYEVGTRILLVDTANGHGQYAVNAVRRLRSMFDDVHIMTGNIATSDGFARLVDAGADSIRAKVS